MPPRFVLDRIEVLNRSERVLLAAAAVNDIVSNDSRDVAQTSTAIMARGGWPLAPDPSSGCTLGRPAGPLLDRRPLARTEQ